MGDRHIIEIQLSGKIKLCQGGKDDLSRTSLSAGTYYAMVYKEQNTTGSYSITATLSGTNCAAAKTTTTTTTQTASLTAAQRSQILSQIAQIQSQIALLQAELAAIQKTTTQTQTGGWCYTFKNTIKYKDQGDDVKALQTALQKQGFFNGIVDGYFLEETGDAVISFQEKYKSEILTPYGLKSGTGFVGKTTISKLNKLYGC